MSQTSCIILLLLFCVVFSCIYSDNNDNPSEDRTRRTSEENVKVMTSTEDTKENTKNNQQLPEDNIQNMVEETSSSVNKNNDEEIEQSSIDIKKDIEINEQEQNKRSMGNVNDNLNNNDKLNNDNQDSKHSQETINGYVNIRDVDGRADTEGEVRTISDKEVPSAEEQNNDELSQKSDKVVLKDESTSDELHESMEKLKEIKDKVDIFVAQNEEKTNVDTKEKLTKNILESFAHAKSIKNEKDEEWETYKKEDEDIEDEEMEDEEIEDEEIENEEIEDEEIEDENSENYRTTRSSKRKDDYIDPSIVMETEEIVVDKLSQVTKEIVDSIKDVEKMVEKAQHMSHVKSEDNQNEQEHNMKDNKNSESKSELLNNGNIEVTNREWLDEDFTEPTDPSSEINGPTHQISNTDPTTVTGQIGQTDHIDPAGQTSNTGQSSDTDGQKEQTGNTVMNTGNNDATVHTEEPGQTGNTAAPTSGKSAQTDQVDHTVKSDHILDAGNNPIKDHTTDINNNLNKDVNMDDSEDASSSPQKENKGGFPLTSKIDWPWTIKVKSVKWPVVAGVADIDPGDPLYNEAMVLVNNTKTKSDKRILVYLEQAAYEYHHKKAQEYLGKTFLFGEQVIQNFSKAFELFKMAANSGSPMAQQMLGFMYASGIHVNSSQSKALVYFTFSALGGDIMAEITLGYRYFSGITVTESCETSLTYYRRAASKVMSEVSLSGGPLIQRTRLAEEADQNGNNVMLDEDLIQYYQFLADKGDVQAQVGLGQLHFLGGRGVEQDHAIFHFKAGQILLMNWRCQQHLASFEMKIINFDSGDVKTGKTRAFRYFQLAAEGNNANAYAFLGKMYSAENNAVEADNKTALKFFKKAADLGNPVGQSGVGLMYLLGKGVEKDYNKAIRYFRMAADQGWVDGQLQLGTMFYHGLGVKRDYKQAIKFFNLASQAGNIQAIYYLGRMYSTGTGIIRSCRTATELFKNVAERGRWSSMLMDANKAYKSGQINEALLKYTYLAELGYEIAQSNVAYILDQELNTIMSDNYTYPRALLYWTRAAEQGFVGARVKVGDYYYYGHGTKVNYENAAFHYTIAQEQHRSAQAMFNLGYMHERGLGMKQDIHLAKRFYDMAAESSPDAQAPVSLALFKLAIIYGLQWLKNNYNFWSYVNISSPFNDVGFEQYLGENWDIYVMAILAVLLTCLLFVRQRFTL